MDDKICAYIIINIVFGGCFHNNCSCFSKFSFVIGFDKIFKFHIKELTFDCIVIIIGIGMMKLILVVLLILVVVNGFRPISDRKISRITLNTLSLAKIALTREEGANDKLKSLLQKLRAEILKLKNERSSQ